MRKVLGKERRSIQSSETIKRLKDIEEHRDLGMDVGSGFRLEWNLERAMFVECDTERKGGWEHSSQMISLFRVAQYMISALPSHY